MTAITMETNTCPSRSVETIKPSWSEDDDGLGYRCEILLKGNSRAGYIARIAELDSAVSQGDNPESAIKNVIEAFQGCIKTYVSNNMLIPWSDPRKTKKCFAEDFKKEWDQSEPYDEVSYWAVVNA